MSKRKELREAREEIALLNRKLWESIQMGAAFADLLGKQLGIDGSDIIREYSAGRPLPDGPSSLDLDDTSELIGGKE